MIKTYIRYKDYISFTAIIIYVINWAICSQQLFKKLAYYIQRNFNFWKYWKVDRSIIIWICHSPNCSHRFWKGKRERALWYMPSLLFRINYPNLNCIPKYGIFPTDTQQTAKKLNRNNLKIKVCYPTSFEFFLKGVNIL